MLYPNRIARAMGLKSKDEQINNQKILAPLPNTTWMHNRTNEIYEVLHIANREATKPGYPLTVVYRRYRIDGTAAPVWTRPASGWLESFHPIHITGYDNYPDHSGNWMWPGDKPLEPHPPGIFGTKTGRTTGAAENKSNGPQEGHKFISLDFTDEDMATLRRMNFPAGASINGDPGHEFGARQSYGRILRQSKSEPNDQLADLIRSQKASTASGLLQPFSLGQKLMQRKDPEPYHGPGSEMANPALAFVRSSPYIPFVHFDARGLPEAVSYQGARRELPEDERNFEGVDKVLEEIKLLEDLHSSPFLVKPVPSTEILKEVELEVELSEQEKDRILSRRSAVTTPDEPPPPSYPSPAPEPEREFRMYNYDHTPSQSSPSPSPPPSYDSSPPSDSGGGGSSYSGD